MFNIFRRKPIENTEPESAEEANTEQISIIDPVKIQSCLDFCIKEFEILAKASESIANDAPSSEYNPEQNKYNELVISSSNALLKLYNNIHTDGAPTTKTKLLFNRYANKIIELYFNRDHYSHITLLHLETELQNLPAPLRNKFKIEIIKLYIKISKNFIASKNYSLAQLYSQIITTVVDHKIVETDYALLRLNLLHNVYAKTLLQILECKKELNHLNTKIKAPNNVNDHYLVAHFNNTLSVMLVVSLRAALCSMLIKLCSSPDIEEIENNYEENNLQEAFNEYLQYHLENYGHKYVAETMHPKLGLEIPENLVINIEHAVIYADETLECQAELLKYVIMKPTITPPPIPSRSYKLKPSCN